VAALLGAIGLIAVTLWLGSPGDLRQIFSLSGRTVAGGLVMLGVSFLAGGMRLAVILRLAGTTITIWRAVRAHVLGLFAAAITPSGGGNGFAIGFALQRDGVRSDVAWSAAVYGTVLDLLFYAWTIPVAGVVLFREELITARLLWLALGVSVLSFGLWYGLAFHLKGVRHLAALVVRWRPLRRWRAGVMRFIDAVATSTSTITARGVLPQLLLSALSLLVHAPTYVIFFLLAAELGSPLGLVSTLALLVLISAVSQVVPTPGGSGYFEVAITYAFTQRGAPSQVTAAVIAYRAITFYVPIVLGALLGGTVLIGELRKNGAENQRDGVQQA
jgi:uncharacterized protein (TIRG00374 family)